MMSKEPGKLELNSEGQKPLHSLKTAVFGGSEFSEDVDIYAFMLESGSLGRVVKALK